MWCARGAEPSSRRRRRGETRRWARRVDGAALSRRRRSERSWERHVASTPPDARERTREDLKHAKKTQAFDDFADWYTDGGYKVASWLELLDLSKWVL